MTQQEIQVQDEISKLNKMSEKNGRPFRLLIVDDEQWVREVFRDFCELTKVLEVEMASSGEEALSKIRTGKFDLVTLDIIMPELSGLETLIAMKRITPQVPVMLVTGNATDKLVTKAGVMGACQVMYKPVRLENFISGVASALSR